MRSMKSDAVGELGERVVEGAIRELALERRQGAPARRADGCAPSSVRRGWRGPGGVWSSARASRLFRACASRARDIRPCGPSTRSVTARPPAMFEAVRRAARPTDRSHAAAMCTTPKIGGVERSAPVVLEVDRAHHVDRLAAAQGRPECSGGAGLGDERQLGAFGAETPARAPEHVDRRGVEVARLEQRDCWCRAGSRGATSRGAPPPTRRRRSPAATERDRERRRARSPSAIRSTAGGRRCRDATARPPAGARSMPPWRSSCSISLGGKRMAEVIALTREAAEAEQPGHLRRGFDPLGDDLQLQRLGDG